MLLEKMEIEICPQTKSERNELFALLKAIKTSSVELADLGRPLFNGKRYVSGKELRRKLCCCKRTIANYIAKGYIGYHCIDGKNLYDECEIEDLLKDNYIPPFK